MEPSRDAPVITRVVLMLIACAAPVAAQQAQPSRLAIDTAAAFDEAVDGSGNWGAGVILDAVASFDLGHGFEALARPFVQRLANGEWNRQVWVAALRYQRAGRVGLRVDAGLIPPPVGLTNLTLRPHLNPTISQFASLFVPLPTVAPGAPRLNLLGGIYPYGANVTVSASHWDARVAIIDTSPLRARRIFAQSNPPQFANVVVGGGVTPFVGLRVGASVTRGGYQRAGESPAATADRSATVITVESEFSVRYTRMSAEWVRDVVETGSGDKVASGWWLQAQQTLAPRWFAAARVERMASPAGALATPQELHFTGFEETIGFRLTPDLTLRAGHRARRGFFTTTLDNQIATSVVWWKRWW